MAVVVTVEGTAGVTYEQIVRSDLFSKWMTYQQPGWQVKEFHVLWSFVRPDGEVSMLFARVLSEDPGGHTHNLGVLLRGGTVGILPIIITPSGQQYVVLVEQSRAAVGATILAMPAGMVDGGDRLTAALRELDEEVAVGLNWSEPLSLVALLLGREPATYVTPGGSDESRMFYVTYAELDDQQVEQLHGTQAGLAGEGERTTVQIVPLADALTHLATHPPLSEDTLLALLMLQELRRRGAIAWLRA